MVKVINHLISLELTKSIPTRTSVFVVYFPFRICTRPPPSLREKCALASLLPSQKSFSMPSAPKKSLSPFFVFYCVLSIKSHIAGLFHPKQRSEIRKRSSFQSKIENFWNLGGGQNVLKLFLNSISDVSTNITLSKKSENNHIEAGLPFDNVYP